MRIWDATSPCDPAAGDTLRSMSGSASPLADRLRAAGFRGELFAGAPLAPYTTWRIGGPAELLAEPLDEDDLVLAVAWARSSDVPFRVLGNGSNLLIQDEGVRGLVLRTRRALDRIERDGNRIRAGAGASLPAVANLAASVGLGGLEFAAGIPGTMGGAMVMNAGWHEHEIGPLVRQVDFLPADRGRETWPHDRCAFGYRRSAFRGRPGVVLGALIELQPADRETVRVRLDNYLASRRASQPTELPSCGSVFLKPPGDFAGRLIEEAGLKGQRIGDVQVSPKHANFFVNLGTGTAADALALIERVERLVELRSGVRLVREVEVW